AEIWKGQRVISLTWGRAVSSAKVRVRAKNGGKRVPCETADLNDGIRQRQRTWPDVGNRAQCFRGRVIRQSSGIFSRTLRALTAATICLKGLEGSGSIFNCLRHSSSLGAR